MRSLGCLVRFGFGLDANAIPGLKDRFLPFDAFFDGILKDLPNWDCY